MNYELAIHPGAEKEWVKLDGSIKRRFKEKPANERLKHPRVAKDSLRELPDCYKTTITTPQCRLIYHGSDTKQILTILSVVTRDDVYAELRTRLGGRVGNFAHRFTFPQVTNPAGLTCAASVVQRLLYVNTK